MGRLVTKGFDLLLSVVGVSKFANACFGFLVGCLIAAALSSGPLVLYFIYSNDMHISLWTDEEDLYPMFLAPIVCYSLVLIFLMVHACKPSAGATKVLIVGSLLLGGAVLPAGGWLMMKSFSNTTERLEESDCTIRPMASAIQETYWRLDTIYRTCDPKRKTPIRKCPGLEMHFPEMKNRAAVDYIQQMEKDFDCVGFCQGTKFIFERDADEENLCAVALGEYLDKTVTMLSFTLTCLGGLFLVGGLCLVSYDHI